MRKRRAYSITHRNNHIRKLKKSDFKKVVAVGWMNNSHSRYADNQNVTTAEVAVFHEYGTEELSPTGFFTGSLDYFIKSSRTDRRKISRSVGRGEIDVKNGLEMYGAMAAQIVQDEILAFNLIDTGLLRRTVSHEVRDN